MSEQNPYAPVATPVLAPPPQGFAPPPAPAPVQAYQSAGMALTELSFAPLPTEAPEAPVPPPPPAGQSLVTNVLPSGGVARSLSLGGRMPLIALIVVLLLGAGAAAYSTGMIGGTDEPEPVVVPKKKAPVTAPKTVASSAPAAAAKPAAKPESKPAVKPLAGKALSVTKANSGTLGKAYTVTVPTGWDSQLNVGRDDTSNRDVIVRHARTEQALQIWSAPATFVKGPLNAAKLKTLKANDLGDNPGANALPGDVRMTIAGVAATGFDATMTVAQTPMKVRSVYFEKGGVVYGAVWVASPDEFEKSLATFDRLAASVAFAK